jgi:hypothetical protein
MAQATEVRPQARNWSGTAKGSDGAFAEPMFSSSVSSLQSVTVPRQRQPEHGPQAQQKPRSSGPVFSQSSHDSQGFVGRMKTIVQPKNLMSTFMAAAFIKGWGDKTLGTWGIASPFAGKTTYLSDQPWVIEARKLLYGKEFDKRNLEKAKTAKPGPFLDKAMAVSVTAGLIQNIAFFLTKRGGEVPEGDTMFERALNAIKHPDRHSVHFSNATLLPVV